MTTISSHHQTTNSSLTNQNSISSNSSKNSNPSLLYLGPNWTNLPGVGNLYYAPRELLKCAEAFSTAKQIEDKEGIVTNGLRASAFPFTFTNALSQLAWYVLKIGLYFNIISSTLTQVVVPLSIYISGLGFIMCAIEGILEIYGLVKTKHFYSDQFPSDLKKRFNSPESEKNSYIERLKNLQQTYLQISPESIDKIEADVKHKFPDRSPDEQQKIKERIVDGHLKKKKSDLIRRIDHWLADEIQENASQVLQDLQSSNPLKSQEAQDKTAEIFKNIKTQSIKKFLIHAIGLAAVLIAVVGLILCCVHCPFFIPIILLMIGAGLSLTRYYLNLGFMNSKGWEFNSENCLPSFLKNTISHPEQKPPEPFLPLTLHHYLTPKQNSPCLANIPFLNNYQNIFKSGIYAE